MIIPEFQETDSLRDLKFKLGKSLLSLLSEMCFFFIVFQQFLKVFARQQIDEC